MANYLNYTLENSCKKSQCLALTLKSLNFTSINNIDQNFYMSRSNTKKHQNSEFIYCRS